MMKKKNIFAFLLMLGLIAGVGSITPLQIFDPIQITLESNIQGKFKPINGQCFVNQKGGTTLEKSPIRLLSWNIHKGVDQDWKQDLARFSQNQDFVLLQEATPEQNLSSFSTALFVSAFAYKGLSSGVKTFSHRIPQRYCGISQAEPWIRIPKVANVMLFPFQDGDELLLINAHLINFEWESQTYREQLAQIFSFIQAHKSAVILAGDFNAWNEERKKILDEFVTQAGLNEVSFVPDERRYFFNYPLDFVFVRGMKILSAKTKTVMSSDHSPIWVELAFE
ncbi:hypothetical protein BKK51_08440 [Rodentibacter trehalosifermentans]|uniref:Endonuclease/exonuclease/phosphatase domain-containing protein n=1 Tax=Rodentibacter trehalosifermentans TaxID=1908263 RepID=A0A1V3IRL6_9PAST|nr:endonuclease/exonuclease/phosphatase family protein [Rodentibacter trehalosifermentans]OOF44746.1 hypothetical protein BKK51_08440 [Rodentibacter trehalosifermentans]OOF49551.1 hypothetical protein BKK52_03290 [Rodentibacter trehalosifermentans]